jgi:hypothetical protein
VPRLVDPYPPLKSEAPAHSVAAPDPNKFLDRPLPGGNAGSARAKWQDTPSTSDHFRFLAAFIAAVSPAGITEPGRRSFVVAAFVMSVDATPLPIVPTELAIRISPFGVELAILVADIRPPLPKIALTVALNSVIQPISILQGKLKDLRSRIHPSAKELRHSREVIAIKKRDRT